MSDRLTMTGTHVAPYGLVVVLRWIGGMKFTAYEAEAIRPMVANSPLMGWIYNVMSTTAFSSLLGVIDVAEPREPDAVGVHPPHLRYG
jgi:uncharacterized membrane protein YkgB